MTALGTPATIPRGRRSNGLTALREVGWHDAAPQVPGHRRDRGRVTNFTSGQGLVLMKEVLYTIAGKRLSLQGNPDAKEDWYRHPKTGEAVDFITFARTERRFAKPFRDEGTPPPALLAARDERLANWRRVQELAGYR